MSDLSKYFALLGRKKILLYSGILLGCLAFVFLMYAVVYVPKQQSDVYLGKIDGQVADLKKQLMVFSKSTQSPLFNTPDLSYTDKKAAIASIESIIRQTSDNLTAIEQTNRTLPSFPVAEAVGLLKDATDMHTRIPNTISQTREVIHGYEQLITYLKLRLELDVQLSSQFEQFNSISNYDVLVGDRQPMLEAADKARALVVQLKALTVPAGLEKSQESTITTYTEAGADFQGMYDALLTRNELTIDKAAHEIERTTEQHENVDKNFLFDSLGTLSTIEDVADVIEKVDRY